MPQLDLDDIQSGVVSLGNMIVGRYLMYSAEAIQIALARQRTAGASAQDSARSLTSLITVAANRRSQPHVNIAFTNHGLIELGLPAAARGEFPLAFATGAVDRAADLGDTGSSRPDTWEQWSTAGTIAVLISITGPTLAMVTEMMARIVALLGEPAHTQAARAIGPDGDEIGDQPAGTTDRDGRYEHFGFRDGLSNPVIEGAGRRVRPGDAALRARRWWPIKPGEFILGYEDETNQIRLGPHLRPYFRNGSYVVWRKLQQDVAGFHRHASTTRAKAQAIGRWPNGSPLATWPDGPAPDGPGEPYNGFTFATDPAGNLCPISAHIRRTNPRDGLDMADVLVNRHRLLRRGLPYTDTDSSGTDKGLIFVCYNSDIERQFEFVQRRWMSEDPFRSATPTVDPIASFVTTRAGLYLFQPGLLGCERLLGQLL